MTESNSLVPKRQDIIYLDVGGSPFKILKSTISRYPDSLLGRMLKEFHNLGEQDDPLFIDRSPTAFPWILEIYRDGDHARCVPDMSPGFLRRELDFYQLPVQAALDAESLTEETHSTTEPNFDTSDILSIAEVNHEIARWGLVDLWPIDVFVYHHFERGSNEKLLRKLFLRPSLSTYGSLPCNAREHVKFSDVLYGRRPLYSRERFGNYIQAFEVDQASDSQQDGDGEDDEDDFTALVKVNLTQEAASLNREAARSGWAIEVRRDEAPSFRKNLQFHHLVIYPL